VPQQEKLRKGIDVVVATPGRLLDHMERGNVKFDNLEILVLDEADRMLDMGFLPPLKRIASALPRERQTLLFSATLPEDVLNLSRQFTRDAVRVDVSGEQMVAVKVRHQVHHVALDRKREALTGILTEDDKAQALVFCRTKRGANRVGEDLGSRGIRAGVIHGNKSQSARNRALDDFKTGRVRVLVATDIAARGLDIARLPLVVNFDLPLVAEDYVHRVGRTGRAGHDGRAVSLVTGADASLLRDIQRLVAAPIESIGTPVHHTGHTHRAAAPSHAPRGPRAPRRRFGAGGRRDGSHRHAFRGGRA